MKYYQFLTIFALLFICACSENNNPKDPSKESGYRLDSIIEYKENSLNNKVVYYYSNNYKYYDYSYSYVMHLNEGWVLSSRETYKYDEEWNVIEQMYSYYKDGEWIPDWTYNTDYRDHETTDTSIHWDKLGNEVSRTETHSKYDSLYYVILRITETYQNGDKISYDAYMFDNYYTMSRMDSSYTYHKTNLQDSYACQGKTIYMKQDGYDVTIGYNYNGGEFIPNSKSKIKLDFCGNVTSLEYYRWENEKWVHSFTNKRTYTYYLDTELIETKTEESIDYDENGDIMYTSNRKEKYYYTKY